MIDGSYDETYADVKQDVVIAATLMDVEFPERELWKAEVKEKLLKIRSERLQEESQRLEGEKRRLQLEEERLMRENKTLRQRIQQVEGEEEEEQTQRRVGRNDPCPCGSGKKFKKCCLRKQQGDDHLWN